MFFLVPSSRQTRRTIWSGVSVNDAGRALGENCLGQLAGSDLLAELEGVEVGDDDLGLAELLRADGRERCRAGGSSCPGRSATARAAGRGW